jgi:hypothetical protein
MNPKRLKAFQKSDLGKLYVGKAEDLLTGVLGQKLEGKSSSFLPHLRFRLIKKRSTAT